MKQTFKALMTPLRAALTVSIVLVVIFGLVMCSSPNGGIELPTVPDENELPDGNDNNNAGTIVPDNPDDDIDLNNLDDSDIDNSGNDSDNDGGNGDNSSDNNVDNNNTGNNSNNNNNNNNTGGNSNNNNNTGNNNNNNNNNQTGAYPQIIVNFEDDAWKSVPYAGKDVDFGGYNWRAVGYSTMDDNDRRDGSRSLRLRGSNTADKDEQANRLELKDYIDGIKSISFDYASYSDHKEGVIIVSYQKQSDTNWTEVDRITAGTWAADGWKTASYTINQAGNVRFKIEKLYVGSGKISVNIDNIIINGNGSSSNESTFAKDKFAYYWVNEADVLVATNNGNLSVNLGEELIIQVQGSGYTDHQWYLDGLKTTTGSAFTFSSWTLGKHIVNLVVVKDGKPYSAEITITVAPSAAE